MKKQLLLAAIIAVAPLALATTVIPPTFDELVDQADTIFHGQVTQVKSEWVGEGAQRHIMSYVTFKVADSLKGNAGSSYTIRMLGGTVDGETMGVTDAPRFAMGDEDILFVQNNGSQFIPLVGIMHGRFHVQKGEAGQDLVVDHDGAPVRSLERLGKPNTMELSNERDFTPDDFKAAIRIKLGNNAKSQ
jgi:hypothetical protein